ncbi:hypothetical protein [Bradyrhizobium sp. ARR65]|uniref:hypothetical protein n=1 Tax=Bradyrhizobium sp. ARR65 TaxID=1040989 RepID=UPI000465297F|nr:hypothetical protein [Bradyrhizobium sp. ARR65]
MARTAAGQVSANGGIFARARMLGAALMVALGPVADVLPAAAQSAPAGGAQQAPFSPFTPFPSPTPSPAQVGRPATRPVERAHVKPHVVRPHPGPRKVVERKETRKKLAESKQSRRKLAESKESRKKPAESKENQREIAESKGYKRVSDLVNFPKFFPGLGIIFVRPDTLPTGPFLCFDRKDHLVATVYMIPTKDIDDHRTLEAAGASGRVDHVSFYFNPGHPGVDMPHYHFVIWHVPKKEEARVAQ